MNYEVLDIHSVIKYAKDTPQISAILDDGDYTAKEAGDGNLILFL